MLVISRIGAYCLNTLTEHHGMGTMVHRFIGDDAEAWCESTLGCRALINGKPVATLFMDPLPDGNKLPTKVTIHIESIWGMVRPKNIGEFDPAEYGIEVNYTQNWMGDKEADLIADIHLDHVEEQIPGLFTPRKALPQSVTGRVPIARGSMDRRKYH